MWVSNLRAGDRLRISGPAEVEILTTGGQRRSNGRTLPADVVVIGVDAPASTVIEVVKDQEGK